MVLDLREEDNLSTKDNTPEFILLSPICPQMSGFTVFEISVHTTHSHHPNTQSTEQALDGFLVAVGELQLSVEATSCTAAFVEAMPGAQPEQ